MTESEVQALAKIVGYKVYELGSPASLKLKKLADAIEAKAHVTPPATGWPPGMLQDDSKALSKALAAKPDYRRLVRESAQEILYTQFRKTAVQGALEEAASAISTAKPLPNSHYTQWNSGPPPSIGWWPAGFLEEEKTLRWYSGDWWSVDCWEDESAEVAGQRAQIKSKYSAQIKWTDRPANWPARSRT